MPISSEVPSFFMGYVDLDYKLGSIRNYKNENNPIIDYYTINEDNNVKPGTWDNHQGIDINCMKGDPVVSMAPGEVIFVNNNVAVLNDFGESIVYITMPTHNHASLVSEGEYVERGQAIALCGDWLPLGGDTQEHIHLNFFILKKEEIKQFEKTRDHKVCL